MGNLGCESHNTKGHPKSLEIFYLFITISYTNSRAQLEIHFNENEGFLENLGTLKFRFNAIPLSFQQYVIRTEKTFHPLNFLQLKLPPKIQ